MGPIFFQVPGLGPMDDEIPSFVRRNGCYRFKAAMAKWGAGPRKPQYKTRASKQSVLLTAKSLSLQTVALDGVQKVKLFLGPQKELRRVKVGDSLRI